MSLTKICLELYTLHIMYDNEDLHDDRDPWISIYGCDSLAILDNQNNLSGEANQYSLECLERLALTMREMRVTSTRELDGEEIKEHAELKPEKVEDMRVWMKAFVEAVKGEGKYEEELAQVMADHSVRTRKKNITEFVILGVVFLGLLIAGYFVLIELRIL